MFANKGTNDTKIENNNYNLNFSLGIGKHLPNILTSAMANLVVFIKVNPKMNYQCCY